MTDDSRRARTRTTRLAGVVFVTFAMASLLGWAAPANAHESNWLCFSHHTCTHKDKARDAPARVDILRSRVSNAAYGFKVRVKVRNLKRTGRFVLGAGVWGWGQNYYVTKRRHGYRVQVQGISEVHVYKKASCGRAVVHWSAKKNVIRAKFPYDCAGKREKHAGSVINGVILRSGKAVDRSGKVYKRPS